MPSVRDVAETDLPAIQAIYAREVLTRNEPAPMWFIRTVDGWLTASPSPQVPELVDATGMSIRSVERMTKHYYGLSPRMLARKYRAVRAASALARGEGLDAAQLGDAFYDQSHLIREIKRFAEATPGGASERSAPLRAKFNKGTAMEGVPGLSVNAPEGLPGSLGPAGFEYPTRPALSRSSAHARPCSISGATVAPFGGWVGAVAPFQGLAPLATCCVPFGGSRTPTAQIP